MRTFLIRISCTIIFLALNDVRAAFTEAEKMQFVVAHNRIRESASPTAVAMRFLKWSERLAGLAQKAAEKCIFDHNYGKEYDGLGENIYKGGRSDPTDLTTAWYTEKCDYNHETRGCRGVCGHYEQVMTEGVTEIGCGIHQCSGTNLVFCEYNAGAGYYKYGPPCSACPKAAPFCVNNLCVSSADLAAPAMKEWDATITASSMTCNLGCKNCGNRITAGGACACECKHGATGDFCEALSDPKSAARCSSCIESLACQSGGVEETKDPAVCGSCKCTSGFAGDRCEIPGEDYENSVRIVLAAENPARLARFMVMPPVTKSELNTKIWPQLQNDMTKAVNEFCRSDALSLKNCCPGKRWATGLTVNHLEAADFKLISSSIFNNFDNSLSLMIYARSTSTLCSTKTATTLPQALLLSVIEKKLPELSDALKGCCGKIKLRSVAKPTGSTRSPIGSVPMCDGTVPLTPKSTGGTPTSTGGTPTSTGGTPTNTGGTPTNTGGTPTNTGGALTNHLATLTNSTNPFNRSKGSEKNSSICILVLISLITSVLSNTL